jgi:Bacterial EndoU nuclease
MALSALSQRPLARLVWRSLPVSLTALILGSVEPAYTQKYAQKIVRGSFVASQACFAPQAINGANPGEIKLTIGTVYDTVGFNSDRRTHVLVRIPNATPTQRWVAANCGEFRADSANQPEPETKQKPRRNSDKGKPSNVVLLPFFDNETNPIRVENSSEERDITPPPPKLEPFDRKILQLCGAEFDAPVREEDFKTLIRYYPDVQKRLKQAAGGAIFANRSSDAEFLEDLGSIWFKHKGFKHIFCGEKDGNSIGGLHFVGRYLEFQEKGIAGRITRTSTGQDAKEEVVEGAIYTFGVAVKKGDRLIAEHRVKGYGYVSNALEMLIDGTRAFKQFNVPANTPPQESVACLYTVRDPQTQPFQAVFVKKGNAIRTFYPDATPEDSRANA